MDTSIYPSFEMSPIVTLVAVVIATVWPIWLAVVGFGRARKRRQLAAEAAAMLDPDHPLSGSSLREGEILLSGVVEHAPNEDVAVKVEVSQLGTESESSGSWSYRWEEVDRQIIVRPFYLRLTNQTRVKVFAPPNVEVADDLDQKVLISNTSRKLSAELIPGESLHARGYLQRGDEVLPGVETGYRDAAYSWELRPANGRMLLSSEPLGEGMQKRAAFHRRAAVRAVILFLILQGSFLFYYARALGSTHPVKVLHREHSTYKDSDGDTQHKYEIIVELPGGKPAQVEIDGDDFERAREGKILAIRQGAFDWQLGGWPTLTWFHGPIVVFLSFALVALYNARRASTRPWFKRKVVHTGSGRLPGD